MRRTIKLKRPQTKSTVIDKSNTTLKYGEPLFDPINNQLYIGQDDDASIENLQPIGGNTDNYVQKITDVPDNSTIVYAVESKGSGATQTRLPVSTNADNSLVQKIYVDGKLGDLGNQSVADYVGSTAMQIVDSAIKNIDKTYNITLNANNVATIRSQNGASITASNFSSFVSDAVDNGYNFNLIKYNESGGDTAGSNGQTLMSQAVYTKLGSLYIRFHYVLASIGQYRAINMRFYIESNTIKYEKRSNG